jgi:diguanylate cyclase (GGDEF)-like protein
MARDASLATKVVLVAVAAATCVVVSAALARRSVLELINTADRTEHTYVVLLELAALEARLLDMETDQRGYLLTGSREVLAPYEKADAAVTSGLARVRELTVDNSAQQERLAKLADLVKTRRTELGDTLALRDRSGLDASAKQARVNFDRNTMRAIRDNLDQLQASERELLAARRAAEEEALVRNLLTIAAVVLGTIAILIALGVLIFRDLQRNRHRGDTVNALAYRDALTGLPNRAAFETRLAELLPGSEAFAVMLADLDGFKNLNDTQGRAAGDRVLVEIARRLSARVREPDFVARFPDDRFAVLATQAHNTAEASATARRVLATIAEPCALADGNRKAMHASAGLVICPADGTDVATLLGRVESALYRAKAAGKNTYRFRQTSEPAAGGAALSA